MNYRSPIITSMLVVALFSLSAVLLNDPAAADEKLTKDGATQLSGLTVSTMDVGGYTYVEVDTGKQKVWAAGPVTRLKVGDRVSFSSGMPMENYYSKSMNRNFSILYFVDVFHGEDGTPMGGKADTASPHDTIKKKPAAEMIKGITRVEGGNTIAEIYAQKAKLKDKKIRVRGKVTKYSSKIMGRNWLHIRDSSTQEDLTITTRDVAKVGDIVVVEGKLGLEKDFGYGYVYPVILQDAKVIK